MLSATSGASGRGRRTDPQHLAEIAAQNSHAGTTFTTAAGGKPSTYAPSADTS
jgi:hypothetical protein